MIVMKIAVWSVIPMKWATGNTIQWLKHHFGLWLWLSGILLLLIRGALCNVVT